MKAVIATILILLTSNSLASNEDFISVCEKLDPVKIDAEKFSTLVLYIGNGDYAPLVKKMGLSISNLYVDNGTAWQPDYIAAVTWALSAHDIGIKCSSEMARVYEQHTGKHPDDVYIAAFKSGIQRALPNKALKAQPPAAGTPQSGAP